MTQTVPITQADLPALVGKMKKKQEFIITVHGKPAAVLISPADYNAYESWKETEEILADKKLMKSIKRAEADIAAGRVYDWEDNRRT